MNSFDGACVAASVVTLGAIAYANCRTPSVRNESVCSARAAKVEKNGVSAKAVVSETQYPWWEGEIEVSEGSDEQFKNVVVPKNAQRANAARFALTSYVTLDSPLDSNNIGQTVLTAGGCSDMKPKHTKPQMKIEEIMPFGANENMAQAIEVQESA